MPLMLLIRAFGIPIIENKTGEIVPDSKDRIRIFQSAERFPITQEDTRKIRFISGADEGLNVSVL